MMGPSFGTAFVLLSVSVVKVFDVVVAMTQGGPGLASEVPAKFIIDNLLVRANIGLASAASTVLLLTVLALLAPWFYARAHASRRAERVARALRASEPQGRPHERARAVASRGLGVESVAERRRARAAASRIPRPARIGLYVFLVTAALLFLLPLYVMVATSIKPMEEIRLGNLFALPVKVTLAPWAQAWMSACTGPGVRRHPRRLHELGGHRRAQHGAVDPAGRAQRLRAVVLAAARGAGACSSCC